MISYEKTFEVKGRRLLLALDRSRDDGDWTASVFRCLDDDYELEKTYKGAGQSCVRWLARALDKKGRETLYSDTGMDAVHQQQSERIAREFDAAEQYVAAYLAIHCGLTVHRSKPGSPSKDLTAYLSERGRGCAIQVKWRGNPVARVTTKPNPDFDFVVIVTPDFPFRGAGSHTGRRNLTCFIVPSGHVDYRGNVDFRYANYQENWALICDYFKASSEHHRSNSGI